MFTRVASIIIAAGTILFFAARGYAAPLLQSTIPNFLASAKTSISITVTLADGQTIVVPVTLLFGLEYDNAWGGQVSLNTEVKQQPGMTIAVSEAKYIDAGMVIQGPSVAAAPAVVVATVTVAPVVVVANPTLVPPTVAPVVIAATPTAVPPTVITLQSQGLGMLFEEWKAIHGEPTSEVTGGAYVFDKPEGFYFVIDYYDRITHVARDWPTGNWPSFDDAKAAAQALMPKDAVYQTSYSTETSFVEVYFSKQLAEVYPNAIYDDVIGEFIVIYHPQDDGTVSSVIVATGNNP